MNDEGYRVALVTGAARGIGRAVSLRLAADGFDVAVNDLEGVADEVRAVCRRAVGIVANVTEQDQVEAMVHRVAQELGRLDVVVANAGVARMVPLVELSAEEWDRVLAVNLRGTFLCYQAGARQMMRQGHGGKIIGATSVAAYTPAPSSAHYTASKWGVRGLTQAAAVE